MLSIVITFKTGDKEELHASVFDEKCDKTLQGHFGELCFLKKNHASFFSCGRIFIDLQEVIAIHLKNT